MCSLKRMPMPAFAKIISNVTFRPSSGFTPQIVAVQFDQIEGVQEDAFVMAAVANAIE
jgi:hypothetical protein